MLTSAWLVLKHHRFEVGSAVILGLLAALAALVISYRLNAIGVPAGCFEQWLTGGGAEGAGDCAGLVQAFAQINEDEAGKVLAFMAVLPFIVGLLAGVSIVGRELEARTAQLGWALTPSRHRWLARQVAPILLVVVVAVAFAAVAASVLEATREPWYHSTYGDLMLHGWPVVGRAIAAFSVGLLVGAVVGRSLPALIVDQSQWLLDHGYQMVALGVPSSKADQLAALDAPGFLTVGLVVGLATIPVVDRRRPI